MIAVAKKADRSYANAKNKSDPALIKNLQTLKTQSTSAMELLNNACSSLFQISTNLRNVFLNLPNGISTFFKNTKQSKTEESTSSPLFWDEKIRRGRVAYNAWKATFTLYDEAAKKTSPKKLEDDFFKSLGRAASKVASWSRNLKFYAESQENLLNFISKQSSSGVDRENVD